MKRSGILAALALCALAGSPLAAGEGPSCSDSSKSCGEAQVASSCESKAQTADAEAIRAARMAEALACCDDPSHSHGAAKTTANTGSFGPRMQHITEAAKENTPPVMMAFIADDGSYVIPTQEQIQAMMEALAEVGPSTVMVEVKPKDPNSLAQGFERRGAGAANASKAMIAKFTPEYIETLRNELSEDELRQLLTPPQMPANWRSTEGIVPTRMEDGSLMYKAGDRFMSFFVAFPDPELDRLGSRCISTKEEYQTYVDDLEAIKALIFPEETSAPAVKSVSNGGVE